MFHNLYICSCITCCLIVYNYLYYHALCGAFSEIKSFKFQVFQGSCHKQQMINNNDKLNHGKPQLQL